MRVGWGVGEGLCKLCIWRCVHLSYLLCLECTRPGFDKHSALMSFIPLFIPYLLTCMTLKLFFFVSLSPLSFLSHYAHSDVFYTTAPLILFFFFFLWLFLPSYLLLSVALSPSVCPLSFSDSLPLSFSFRVIWGIYQQTWSRALLRSALLCVETLIRGIAWQRSPKPASFKSTDVASHTSTHTNPLQVYRSFIDALLQSARLLRNFSTAECRSYLEHLLLCFRCSKAVHIGLFISPLM